jgi:dimethylamine/trimethylamine dehydrogenase
MEAKLPAKDLYMKTIVWYERQLSQLGVEVKTGIDVTADMVLRESYDTIVLATGATYSTTGITGYIPEPIPGAELPHVINPEAILEESVECGPNVLIYDEERNSMAPDLGVLLGSKGKKVEIVTRWPNVGAQLYQNVQSGYTFPLLYKHGVRMTPSTYIKSIANDSVTVYNVFSKAEEVRRPVDTVVMVTGRYPDTRLYKDLKKRHSNVVRVGDCVYARDLAGATFDAHKTMREI